jgi:hypothetical protein
MLATIIATLCQVGVQLLMSLLTSSFFGRGIVHALEAWARKNNSQYEWQMAQDLRKAWGVSDDSSNANPPSIPTPSQPPQA